MESEKDPNDRSIADVEPYEAPRVVEDSPLEVMSLACGKTGRACGTGASS